MIVNRPTHVRVNRAVSVDSLFGPGHRNSLNAIRLVLAACVIIWHTYAVLGIAAPRDDAFHHIVGDLPVNGFFAISGFLIYRSWVARPSVGAFLKSRALRIYPAFWACLVLNAVILAPFAAALQGRSALQQALSPDTLGYVLKNASLAMFQWRIGASPADVPWVTSWNASLWTLSWEFLCYLGLMTLGLLGMSVRRWLLPAAYAGAVVLNLVTLVPALNIEMIARAGRFAVFFLAGSLLAHYSTKLPVSRALAAVCLLFSFAAAWAPGQTAYVLQAPAVAYGLIVLGGLINPRWATLRNDISYGVYIYAFPIQQILVVAGFTGLGVWTFSLLALVCTVPLALLSWFCVEKPMLRLRRKTPVPEVTAE